MKPFKTHSSFFLFAFLGSVIGGDILVSQERSEFFSIKNSDAIRDSLNLIKFVNPNEAERFAFEILEKYLNILVN